MATVTKEPSDAQALPRELEEFIESSIDAMDKRALSRFEKESKKLLNDLTAAHAPRDRERA